MGRTAYPCQEKKGPETRKAGTSPALRIRLGRLVLAAGELDGRRVGGRRRGVERDLPVVHVHDHRLARLELLPQELLREGILDQTLDGAAQRPGPQRDVVALLRQQL